MNSFKMKEKLRELCLHYCVFLMSGCCILMLLGVFFNGREILPAAVSVNRTNN